MTTYYEGQVPRITANFRDSGGVLVDPTNVYFKYKVGNDPTVSYTYGGGQIQKSAVGIYYVDIDTTDKPGKWYYLWYSTGTGATSMKKQEFDVEATDL